MPEFGPSDNPARSVHLFERDTGEKIGEVICPTERDLRALRYALKHVEYIGIEVLIYETSPRV